MKQRMDSGLNLSTTAQTLLKTLAATGEAVRLAGRSSGWTDLTAQWARHVDEAENWLFPLLVTAVPAADGPVGFCRTDHAALSARLAELGAGRPTQEWIREAELLIARMVQHLFLEARILQPLINRMASDKIADRANHRSQGGNES